jgi:hypothetical protein
MVYSASWDYSLQGTVIAMYMFTRQVRAGIGIASPRH